MRWQDKTSTALPLVAAVICLTYNALTACLSLHTPSDPFHLAEYIYMYSLVGCVFCIGGIIGILQSRASLVKAYAQFLLVDAFLSVVCRMLLEELFVDIMYATNVCGNASTDEHWSTVSSGFAIVTSDRWKSKFTGLFESAERCDTALAVLHCVAVGAMFLTSAAQISLAVLMQKTGRDLEFGSPHCLQIEVHEHVDHDNKDEKRERHSPSEVTPHSLMTKMSA